MYIVVPIRAIIKMIAINGAMPEFLGLNFLHWLGIPVVIIKV